MPEKIILYYININSADDVDKLVKNVLELKELADNLSDLGPKRLNESGADDLRNCLAWVTFSWNKLDDVKETYKDKSEVQKGLDNLKDVETKLTKVLEDSAKLKS